MKTRIRIVLVVVVFLILSLSACATPTPEMIVETVVVEKTVEVEVEKVMEKVVVEATEEPLVAAIPLPTAAVPGGASHVLPSVASRPNRLIIRLLEVAASRERTTKMPKPRVM